MPVIAIFSGLYCGAEDIVDEAARRLDYPVVGPELLTGAAKEHGVPVSRLAWALGTRPTLWDHLTHARGQSLIQVQGALADLLQNDSIIYYGPGTLLIPESISHTLRVCLHADLTTRMVRAVDEAGMTSRQAEQRIKSTDKELGRWARELFEASPWDPALYDLAIPVDKAGTEAAVDLICESARAPALNPTRDSFQAAMDFAQAARVNLALLAAGHHYCAVEVREAVATITINKEVIRVEPLAKELGKIAMAEVGIEQVETRMGPGYNKPDIVHGQQFLLPPGALLVDDGQEFALTLSERLKMRDIHSEVVYDAEQALSYLERHEPPVLVLDLRMPGIGGMDVLREVKRLHPGVQVIVLTGHGSNVDRDQAMKLGAFAVMRKPVDIAELTETMRRAGGAADSSTEGKKEEKYEQ